MGSESLLSPLVSPFSEVAMKGAAVNGADIRHPFKFSSAYENFTSAGYKSIPIIVLHYTSFFPLLPLNTTTISSDLACYSAICHYAYAQRD
jgi:hypothetical protein